jgi:uncharacterized protein YjbI with pentapeptide repeats
VQIAWKHPERPICLACWSGKPSECRFVRASLSARFDGRDLSSSELRGANLQDVIGLTAVQLYGSSTDQNTLLPDHLKTRK